MTAKKQALVKQHKTKKTPTDVLRGNRLLAYGNISEYIQHRQQKDQAKTGSCGTPASQKANMTKISAKAAQTAQKKRDKGAKLLGKLSAQQKLQPKQKVNQVLATTDFSKLNPLGKTESQISQLESE